MFIMYKFINIIFTFIVNIINVIHFKAKLSYITIISSNVNKLIKTISCFMAWRKVYEFIFKFQPSKII